MTDDLHYTPQPFDTELDRRVDDTVSGPLRAPAQMLAGQSYGGHASVHDDATAASLGLTAGPIEGPTHFSQFDPLLVDRWGDRWFSHGCLSAHFQTMVVEGEQVRASVTADKSDANRATIDAAKADGTPAPTIRTPHWLPGWPERQLSHRATSTSSTFSPSA